MFSNQATNIAAVFNKFQPTLLSSATNPVISHAIPKSTAPQTVSSYPVATCNIKVNPFRVASNRAPPFFKPIIPHLYELHCPNAVLLGWAIAPHASGASSRKRGPD